MTLTEVIAGINRFDAANTIYSREPWTPTSVAPVATEPDNGGFPEEADRLGLTYFLEVDIARDLAGDLAQGGLTPDAICQRIIAYAVNDA